MRKKLTIIAVHAAAWIFFLSLVLSFLLHGPEQTDLSSQLLSGSFLLFCFVFLFIFYVNSFVLIPQLYLRKKFLLYSLTVLVLFVAVYFLRPFDRLMHLHPPPDMGPPGAGDNGPPPPQGQITDITSIVLFIMIWSLSTALVIIRQWRLTERRALQAEAERTQAELAFLKSQVNPHFLFNTLNNIYSLAISKNENAGPSIMKLSNIMRYVTDEAGQDFVPLDEEVNCMKDYIDLQRMRLGDKMNVQVLFKGNTSDKKITPLLLMTFVENVFKYGTSSHDPSDIIIKLTVEDHTITFFCQNRIFESKTNVERTGIGIPNARKRLLHLYPNKHFLDINTDKNLFTVHLTLRA